MSHCTNPKHKEDSWWLDDARGIPVAKVCDTCEDAVRKKYRLDVMEDSNYTADEPIEEDPW